MNMEPTPRRVVITGFGAISPLGCSEEEIWKTLSEQTGCVDTLTTLLTGDLPIRIGGEVKSFSGHIDNFGSLEKMLKRSIKKGLKLMCREIEMSVAASQLAIADAGIEPGLLAPERIGTLFGSDYILTMPQEFTEGIHQCLQDDGQFDSKVWGESGLPKVDPLWLLKYLPNMPASHVAIYNDLRGPSNSLTMREASSNAAIAEAVTTIRRGSADIMLAGATGTRLHPLRTVHIALQEELAKGSDNPAEACRPFDLNRSGLVLGEGAATVVLESLESAEARSAKILGEVVGYASSTVASPAGEADYQQAFSNVLRGLVERTGIAPADIGHIHAHGLATKHCDAAEATAIQEVFGEATVPVTAAKSYMGNLGAGSGMVEVIASVLAMKHTELFPILNYTTPDPACPIQAATPGTAAGDSFVNLNITPQGQASGVVIRKFAA